MPYDPETWLNRAHCLRLLGYPELGLGDAYKARLLVEAALENRSSPLGTTTFQAFAGKIYNQHMNDPAWAQWRSRVATSALLQARTTDMLKRIEAHIWTELMEGLIACNCCSDYLRMSIAAAEKFPRDEVYPSDVKNAVSWYQQRVTILQAQVDDGDMTAVQMQTTLDNGGVYPTPYPWITESLLVRDDALIEEVQGDFKSASTNCTVFKSTIRNVKVIDETEEATEFDVLGVIATRDIAAGETVVKDITPAGVICTTDRCEACCGALPPDTNITNSCCSIQYCSTTCAQTAIETYHPPLCGKSLTFLHSPALTAKDTTDFALDALLLLRILALSISTAAAHPLLTPILSVLTPAYSMPSPQLIILNFTSHIVTPILTLQALGVDIFTNAAYDTWVLHTMRCRIQNNKHGATLEGLVGSAISPLYSMFNHACEPNVDWRHEEDGNEGGSSTVTMFATRAIDKGEEMCISYIKGQEMGLVERQKVLKGWLGMECGCERCVRERAEEENGLSGELEGLEGLDIKAGNGAVVEVNGHLSDQKDVTGESGSIRIEE